MTWKRVFAWYPVRTEQGDWRWLCYVERRFAEHQEFLFGVQTASVPVYRDVRK